jgi:hypothetical protein
MPYSRARNGILRMTCGEYAEARVIRAALEPGAIDAAHLCARGLADGS